MTDTRKFLAGLAIVAVPMAALLAGAEQQRVAAVDNGRVARGKYLVQSIGCDDCHTPKKMGPNGPILDESRRLSGHPEGSVLPQPPRPRAPGSRRRRST